MFAWLANWWDAAVLWLSELAFPFQFALVIVVLAPLCVLVAWAIDRVVDLVSARITRSGDDAPVRNVRNVTTVKVPTPVVRADVPAGTPATIITTVLHEDRPAVHS